MITKAQKETVIKAIGDLGRRVTVADVASRTGLPVNITSLAINQIASETGGHMEVSGEGAIAYKFRPGFASSYMATGIKRTVQVALDKILKVAFYILKISFGIMLILSLVIVAIAIVVIMTSQKDGDRDRDDFHFDFFDYLILRDIFFWTAYSSRPVTYDYNSPTRHKRKSNFLLNSFSFLFGDGNPNEGLTEKQWQVVAAVIKKHKNVVTAEQLAPYMGTDPRNEDAVLPVLVRFGGKPEVTESGNIVYTFPELTQTATGSGSSSVPPYLREFPWKFTETDAGSLIPVYIVAALNFLGSWFLYGLFMDSPAAKVPLLFAVLVTYGTLFVTVPVVRLAVQSVLNSGIQKRNEKRAGYAEALLSPNPELLKKLSEAREYSIGQKRINDSDVIYTTEKDSLDQEDDLSLEFKKREMFDASP